MSEWARPGRVPTTVTRPGVQLDQSLGPGRVGWRQSPAEPGSFPGDDTTMMVLQLASGRRLRLLVVQGDTEPVAAQAAMDAAAAGQATSASA